MNSSPESHTKKRVSALLDADVIEHLNRQRLMRLQRNPSANVTTSNQINEILRSHFEIL
jgi:uncharacterized protein (DUF4415 family)